MGVIFKKKNKIQMKNVEENNFITKFGILK